MICRKEKDLLTSHKISVVLLIQKYGLLKPKFWGNDAGNDTMLISLQEFKFSPKERKAVCVLISRLIQGSDLSLLDLIEVMKQSCLPRTYFDLFNTGLQELYGNGVDSLLNLFDEVNKFCTQDQTRLESYPCLWTSLVGLHLRQVNLAFRRLGFFHVISLYDKYRSYYEEWKKNAKLDKSSSDLNFLCMTPPNTDVKDHDATDSLDVDMGVTNSTGDNIDGSLLPDDKSKIEHPYTMLSSMSKPTKRGPGIIGNRHQAELFIQEQIALLLQQDPSAAHPSELQETIFSMLKCCPDLGKAHFLSFLNCLRVREQTGAIHSLVKAYDSKIMYKETTRGDDFTRTFRYAALNMAALHAQLGHRQLGLTALEEAIKLAQESNDHVCLQYALAWLYTLNPSLKTTLIKRSLKRSGEMNLSYLKCVSLLNCAKELAKTKIQPAQILKKLLGSGTSFQQNRSNNSMDTNLSGQSGIWGVQAGLWSLWGNTHLTAVCSQLVLRMCFQANFNIHAPSVVSPSCAALCNMAVILANLGEFNLSGELLQLAQQRYPQPWEHSKLWMVAKCYISFYEVLYQGLWSQAKAVAVNMATVRPTFSRLMEAELLVARGEYNLGLEIIQGLSCDDTSEVYLENFKDEPEIMVKTLLLEAEALAGGNNLGGALSTLVKGISLAQQYHMTYYAALGHLHMATIQMHLNLLKESNENLKRGLDVILSSGKIYDQARAKLLQAKLMVRLSNEEKYKENLSSAANILEEVQNLFAQVKAFSREKETVYLKARIHQACGNFEARNKCALMFRQLEQHHPSQSVVRNSCIF